METRIDSKKSLKKTIVIILFAEDSTHVVMGFLSEESKNVFVHCRVEKLKAKVQNIRQDNNTFTKSWTIRAEIHQSYVVESHPSCG